MTTKNALTAFALYFFGFTLLIISCQNESSSTYNNWDHYLGDDLSSQYSALDQINTSNVSRLAVAWTFDGGEAHPENRSQIQCNPLVIDGVVYLTTATLKLVAVAGKTGKKIWSYDPYDGSFSDFGMGVNRGLVWYEDGDQNKLFYCAGKYLQCINPINGTLIESFGDKGSLNLQIGLSDNEELSVLGNTPGVIYQDLLIMGGRVSESTGAAPGHIRAFDVHTGEQRWIFHTIPKPGEHGYNTWPEQAHLAMGGANVWTGFALDEENGIVYCPTGSAAYDFYGGDRHGQNLFANCLLALNANTGKRIWHFQTIHHDMWDKDLPAPPNLMTIRRDGVDIPAVVQVTKNGLLFVFNRITGEPLYPINEMPVPAARLDGEKAWPTQPVPTAYPPFSRFTLTEADLADRNPEAAKFAKAIWDKTYHEAGAFEPLSEEGTIIFPGYDGGGEWGGAAVDHKNGDLIVNSNEIPWLNIMDPVAPATLGEQVYNVLCQNCHGESFTGNEVYGNIPSLVGLKERLTVADAKTIIHNGKGIMPAFSNISDEKVQALYNYINGEDFTEKKINEDWPYPYSMRGYEKLYAPDGYPMIKPPFGQLTSIDMNDKTINWQIPLGENQELLDQGLGITGTENYGGPVVTAGGLVFIAATMDEKIRAFDAATGQELWSYKLPAAGFATPAVYGIDGEQYVLIACGGGKLGKKSGDSWLAFSL